MPIFKSKNEDFFKKWTPEMAYVLGFFIADGSMIINSRGAKYLDFHITDGNLLKKIRNVIGSNHKIRKEVKKSRQKIAYRLQIGSREMFNDLLKLGLKPRKTGHEKLPSIPFKYLKDFLRGYFDGDGNVWKGYTHKKDRPKPTLILVTCFTCKNINFLYSIKRILNKKLELKGSINYHSKAYRLAYSTIDSIKLYNFMYKNLDNNLLLKRKKKVFEKFIKIHGAVV